MSCIFTGFFMHVWAGRTVTLDAFLYMGTNAHKQSQLLQQKPVCSHKIAHFELFRGDGRMCRKILWQQPIEIVNAGYRKIFCTLKNKSRAKEQFYNSIPLSKWKRPHNRPWDACLWKAAERNIVCKGRQPRSVASTKTFNKNQPLVSVLS